jgi:hypothetical protein
MERRKERWIFISKENRIKPFENRVLRKISGSMRKAETEERRMFLTCRTAPGC